MFQRPDASLVKTIHTESFGCDFSIRAILTRFGGLAVFVYHPAHESGCEAMWQGDNVIDARDFVVEWTRNHSEDA